VRYFFRVEYDGTTFNGWQRQPNGPSIQELIENALGVVLRNRIEIVGAGRTDAGVHAKAQGAHFDFDGEINIRKLERSVNSLLPSAIAIYNFTSVDSAFHARFSASARQYKYYFSIRKQPLLYKRVWMIYNKLDWGKIRENIPCLVGKHDFSTFCASGAGSKNTVCTVSEVMLENMDEFLVFTIKADRFIYRMVRSVVGTLIDIGSGSLNDSMAHIIDVKDRMRAGTTAPAYGLVLDNVYYPREMLDETL
jgi:tRNA pseudouridine38-40 synthase